MKKGKKLYEGKAKIIYATSDKNLVIQHFKNMLKYVLIKTYIYLILLVQIS